MKPIPKAIDYVTVKVVRKRSLWNRFYPVIELQTLEGEELLLTSKKMFKNKTSNFHISSKRDVYTKDDEAYSGKIRSKF